MSARTQRILVATDGSPEAETAFAAMMPIVRMDNPDVAMLYVFEEPDASFYPPAQVARTCHALRANGVNAHLELSQGRPAAEIVRLARDRGMDLVVMSTHGRSGIKRLIMGSVAEQVLRRSGVPVLMTRPGTVVHDWNRLVVPLDGSPRGEQILDDVIPLARRMNASVELIQSAMPPLTMGGLGDVGGVAIYEDPLPYLQRVKVRLSAEGVEASVKALEGRAASEILRHAKESDASLLCMATHGRSGIVRVLLGSIAEEVVRHAPCPVLLRRSVPVEIVPEAVPAPGRIAPATG